ncbi:MAG: hypothetical protein ABIR70_02085 [Bryobacteraceae bacterium]
MQRLRGNVYLADGAVQKGQLSGDGRHSQAVDEMSWHLIGLDPDGVAVSCLRYRQYENTVKFGRLAMSSSPIAQSREWGFQTRLAVERDLARARQLGVSFVELGGWAIAPQARYTCEVLRMVLATYATWRILGGGIGIGTVTHRHQSASIVKRLGGQRLSLDGSAIPKYADPEYGCEMELLRFSSEDLSGKFGPQVAAFEDYLEHAPVILGNTLEQEERQLASSADRYRETDVAALPVNHGFGQYLWNGAAASSASV